MRSESDGTTICAGFAARDVGAVAEAANDLPLAEEADLVLHTHRVTSRAQAAHHVGGSGDLDRHLIEARSVIARLTPAYRPARALARVQTFLEREAANVRDALAAATAQ